eukprot:COSAG02_NODE_19192_length_895_cov_1.581658_2_plen_87_part_01
MYPGAQRHFHYCVDNIHSGDYIYRLSPGDPERYEPIPGQTIEYQYVQQELWPYFGYAGDLVIGRYNGPPGESAFCDQGLSYSTYQGT